MNRRARQALTVLALLTAAVLAPATAHAAPADSTWGASATTQDTPWGSEPADGTGDEPEVVVTPLDTTWGSAPVDGGEPTDPIVTPQDTTWG
jgi:hypothetical protein